MNDRPRPEGAVAARLATLAPGLDLLGLPACVFDRSLRYVHANPAFVDQTGSSLSHLLGRTQEEAFGPYTDDGRRECLRRALSGEAAAFNRPSVAGIHKGRWFRAHYFPLRDEAGEVWGALLVLVDVQQLKDAEARLQLVLENVGVPMCYVDRELRLRFANQTGIDWRVASVGEAMGRHVSEVFDAQSMAVIGPELAAAMRGEKRVYERLATRADGEERWLRVFIVPDVAPDGAVRGAYSIVLDVDEDHRMREALQRQEAQLRHFADNIPDAVAYLDRGRRILFANRQFAALRGLTLGQILGRTSAEAMGPEVAAWIAQRTQKVLERGEATSYERLTALPDGSERWFQVKAVPQFDEDGQVAGMYVVAHDIHEVKAAQARLAASEEELRFFAENIPEAICYVDLERGCTFVNHLFLATRGIRREDALGKFPEDVYPAELIHDLAPHIERVKRGEEASYERAMRLPSGKERWVRVRLTPRRDAEGVVRGFYVVSTDIHEIKSAQAEVEDKERQLRQVIDSVPTPMCYVDAEMRYRYVNNAFLDYIGLEPRQIVGRLVVEVLGEERYRQLHPHLERLRTGESLAVERLVRFADGSARWMIVRLTPRISDGRYLGYYATTSDIHEQKVVEEELRRASDILSAHFDNTPLAVIEWDTELRIVRWSGQAEAIFGWNASEALGRALANWRLVYEDDRGSVDHAIADLVHGSMRHATLLARSYRKDGSVIWVEWHHSALRDEAGHLVSILSLAQDVSSRIQAEERLQYMATHDGLTGLPNSVLLNDRLEAALVRARRTHARIGVMFLDLDHFKDVNDTLGHRVGDLLLKELARRIRAALRQSDVLARVSGDEFVVILEDFPDENAPELVARKVLDEVRRPFQLEGQEIHVSGSIGLALHPEDGSDADTLLKNADAAMYHAKELGRNGFRLFSAELAERRSHRLRVETALRRALKAGELELHYQPIVETASGEVHRAEALLRWHDPERGLVLPQGFVPLAEETGLGHAIGHWVLEAACRQARAWRDAGLGDIVVCVNLSAGQLRDTGMIADLKETLAATGCEPAWLQFEITETSMVRDVEGASVLLSRLRSLGVRIAIDDFGTGFSSLSHLRHLPVDVLKIDKAFVADIDAEAEPRARARPRRGGDSAGGAAIVSAVIGLARGLGLDVVAEGVERKSQLHFLAKEGCAACQGYLLCPPLSAADFEAWLRNRARLGAKRKPRRKTARV
jgi:diguanylate cyclase (GGDEF)-like protein/PAS domain S-box-containing protein